MVKINVKQAEPKSWQPKTLEITFQAEQEYEAFRDLCGYSATISSIRTGSGEYIVKNSESRVIVSQLLGDCYTAMGQA